jgi:cell division inhibitor SepF
MGQWRKMGAFLGLVPDDQDRRYEGDEVYADDYGPEYRDDSRHDDRATDRFGDGSYAADHQPYAAEPARPVASSSTPVTQGALAVQSRPEWRRDSEAAASGVSAAAARPVTIKLGGFAEAAVIGEKYREGLPVILDMTEMDDANARRLVDFAAGLAFALHGSIDKVTTKVFMLLPPEADADQVAAAAAYSTEPVYAGR